MLPKRLLPFVLALPLLLAAAAAPAPVEAAAQSSGTKAAATQPAATKAKAAKPDPRDLSLSGAERLRALVDRIKIEQGAVKTMEASFTQRQESEMLLEPDVSRGTFSYAAPDRVRWEYTAPKPISVVIDGDHMTTWYRDLDRADRVKVGRYSNQVLKYMGASGDFDTLLDYFRVRANFPEDRSEPYKLTLLPRYERIERRLKSMTIWIHPQRFLPMRLEIAGGEGDVTEYRFEDFEINQGLPADRFRLELPKSTEVRDIALGGEG